MTRVLRVLGLCAAATAAGCMPNELDVYAADPEPPPQVSVVSSDGNLTVHWSAVEDASGYEVYLSSNPEAAGPAQSCAGESGAARSPCTIEGLTPGQLYYVRVATLHEGYDAAEEAEDLQALSVRAGYPQHGRGPFTWAGIATLDPDDLESTRLDGMWFEDLETGVEHVCYTHWENGSENAIDPCTNGDLAVGSANGSMLWGSCAAEDPVCYIVFEVEASDGRRGESFTRVRQP